jgi:hypothetical protein
MPEWRTPSAHPRQSKPANVLEAQSPRVIWALNKRYSTASHHGRSPARVTMMSHTVSRWFLSSLLCAAALVPSACKRSDPKVSTNEVERCEKGIETAVLQTDVRESLRTYYRECAGIYSEPACKKAFTIAADLEPAQQMSKVIQDCRGAYCPHFQGRGLEACEPNFDMTPVSIVKAWPPLHDAILAADAKGYAPRLSRAMLVFYSRIIQRAGGIPGAPTGSPPASALPAPAPSAALPTPSASVAGSAALGSSRAPETASASPKNTSPAKAH